MAVEACPQSGTTGHLSMAEEQSADGLGTFTKESWIHRWKHLPDVLGYQYAGAEVVLHCVYDVVECYK